MRDITNFDDTTHRIESASAAFQKGIYHLFMLKHRQSADAYDYILRMYQCCFQLGLTQLLLDFNYSVSKLKIQSRLSQLCQDPKQPTRKDLDPGSIVDHSVLERKWNGFQTGHPLKSVGGKTLKLYKRVVDARHNMLYRPFMLDDCYWEDCTLIDLIDHSPDIDEVEKVYQLFLKDMLNWHVAEEQTVSARQAHAPVFIFKNMVVMNYLENLQPANLLPASYFIQLLFIVYKDRAGRRPTETLLLTYARMLNSDDAQLIQEVREYRNRVLDLDNLLKISSIKFLDEWKVGEL